MTCRTLFSFLKLCCLTNFSFACICWLRSKRKCRHCYSLQFCLIAVFFYLCSVLSICVQNSLVGLHCSRSQDSVPAQSLYEFLGSRLCMISQKQFQPAPNSLLGFIVHDRRKLRCDALKLDTCFPALSFGFFLFLQGMLGGLGILILALLNLALFFGLDGHQANEVGLPKIYLFIESSTQKATCHHTCSSNNLAPLFPPSLFPHHAMQPNHLVSVCHFYFRFRSSIRMLRIFLNFLTRLKFSYLLLPVKIINCRCGGVSRPCFDLECYC